MRPFFQQLAEQRQQRGGNTMNVLNDKVLVGAGSTPCTLQFRFENGQNTMLEKVSLSYRIQVTPPSLEMLKDGRRRRGNACMKVLDADLAEFQSKVDVIMAQKNPIQEELDALKSEYNQIMEEWKSVRSQEAELRKIAGLVEPIKYMNDFLQG
jgi:chromosome segregation ATPase